MSMFSLKTKRGDLSYDGGMLMFTRPVISSYFGQVFFRVLVKRPFTAQGGKVYFFPLYSDVILHLLSSTCILQTGSIDIAIE